MKTEYNGLEIAIVGMSCRFPEANKLKDFWSNLNSGKESVKFLDKEELKNVDKKLKSHPGYVNAKGGIIEDIYNFDEKYFNYTPNEIEVMDPNYRLMHELVSEGLEDAGYNSYDYNKKIALFATAASNSSWELLAQNSKINNQIGSFNTALLSKNTHLATRLSYKFNLKGQSIFISTACSSSLVAVHLACRSIIGGECYMALAAGVSLSVFPQQGYIYQKDMILSSDGHCRAFDENADGTVEGQGGGVVVLKLLEDAIKDRDHIYAIIKGSSTNNDGSVKIGYTAPSIESQAEVVRDAMQFGEVSPESISFIETHGTGTSLGDPIEIEALKKAFNTKKRNYCGIGSVKTNIGHLDNASGMAGFIKSVLAIKNKTLPPTLNYKKPNPKIDFENSPFYVNTELTKLEKKDYPIRAGVSSFGIGGTNAHVVLEEFDLERTGTQAKKNSLVLLSAKSETTLNNLSGSLLEFVKENPAVEISDIAYTLQTGRKICEYKRALVVSDTKELVKVLSDPNLKGVQSFCSDDTRTNVAFVFSGIGSHYRGLGRHLYNSEKVFSDEVNRCIDFVSDKYNIDCYELLFADNQNDLNTEKNEEISQFQEAQLITFIIEYALAKYLIHIGIRPNILIGYSLGEYVAACVAGVFSINDALALIVERGKLIQQIGYGKMLSVPLPKKEIGKYLNNNISLAIDNGTSCIVGGLVDDISEFHSLLKKNGFLCMEVNNFHAIHTYLMNPLIEEFRLVLNKIKFNNPEYPVISNLTGEIASNDEITSPDYWIKHLCSTVEFNKGVQRMLETDRLAIIEIGAGRPLCNIIGQIAKRNKHQHLINTLPAKHEKIADDRYLLKRIGQLWLYGVKINWEKYYHDEKRYKTPLPTYPFSRSKFNQVIEDYYQSGILDNNCKTITREKNLANWFYIPVWKQSVKPKVNLNALNSKKFTWLLFIDNKNKWLFLNDKLNISDNSEIILVLKGNSYSKNDKYQYFIDPNNRNDYKKLFDSLHNDNLLPNRIVHTWQTTRTKNIDFTKDYFEESQHYGLYSILNIIQSITAYNIKDLILNILASDVFQVNGLEKINPAKSTLLGPIKVIQQEYPFIKCKIIEFESSKENETTREKLKYELLDDTRTNHVAYRNGLRWVMEYEQVPLNETENTENIFKHKGVYIITGGLGKIGQTFAKFLGHKYQARLVLTGRKDFPKIEEWKKIIEEESGDNGLRKSLIELNEIIGKGAELMIEKIDASNENEMRKLIIEVENKWGRINGVIHAAGNIKNESIHTTIDKVDSNILNEQFVSKVYGTNVLYNIFKEKEPDFVLLTSSLSTVLGGIGFYAYAAASSYLDAFSKMLEHDHSKNWISVNWADWDFNIDSQTGEIEESSFTISPSEGVKTFQRIIENKGLSQIVVSAGPLKERLKKWVDLENFKEDGTNKEKIKRREKPNLLNNYIKPETSIEKQLALLWEDFFGYDGIGVSDNFFELGGDSLKALMLLSKIHKQFNVIIPLSQFFNNPTIANCAVIINKPKIEENSNIKCFEKREYYPLSSSQKGLYAFQKLNMDSTAYNEPRLIKLKTNIDTTAVEKAVNKLIEIHEALRISIFENNGSIIQKINDDVRIKVSHFKSNNAEVEKLTEKVLKPFDFSKAPLLRLAIIELKNEKYLFLDIHHIIADGVSISVFLNDLSLLLNGEEPKRLKGPLFTDFCINQETKNKNCEDYKKFWQNKFHKGIPQLKLPFDYPENIHNTAIEDSVSLSIDNQASEKIREFARQHKITVFSFFNTILYILLNKLTGETYISVGSVISGRDQYPELLPLIGMFINTIPLVTEINESLSFEDFCKKVHDNNLESYKNQEFQQEEILKLLSVKGEGGKNPLYSVMISSEADTESYSKNELENKDDIEITTTPFNGYKMARFNFNIIVSTSGNFSILFKYNSKLFNRETIEKIVSYFNDLIKTGISKPGIVLEEIDLTSNVEKKTRKEKPVSVDNHESKEEVKQGTESDKFSFE